MSNCRIIAANAYADTYSILLDHITWGHGYSRLGTTPAYQAAWPKARPDLEPISTDRYTPSKVEGQLHQGPLLAVGYKTGELGLFR